MKVLIAEDNHDDRRILKYNLEHHGCEVIEAQDGQEGLELAVKHKPDIIISDAMMPGMDGFRFLRAVKQDETLRSIPFIFYTAVYIGYREAELAVSLGAEAYIIKPKEPEELWKELLEVCEEIKQKKEKPLSAELIGEDEEFLRIYSQIVVKKLEDKVKELEKEIEKRKQVEESLRQSEEKYRSIIENIYDFIYSAKPDGTVTFITPNVSAWGYSPEEIVGHSLLEFLHPDDVEKVARDFQRTVTTGEEFPTVARLRKKDGEYLYIEEYGKVLREGEKVVRITGSVRDITDRKNMEQALRESEEKFRKLTETTSAAIFIYKGNQIIYVNPIFEALTGYSKDEIVSLNFWDLVHPDDRHLVKERGIARQRGEEIPQRYEFKFVTKTGEERWVDFTAAAMEFKGSLVGLGTAYDITDRKKAEEEIQRRINDLQDFYEMAIGRELKMKELKEKIKELEEEIPKKNQDEL
jgi:PAS domain S-box-containing protein